MLETQYENQMVLWGCFCVLFLELVYCLSDTHLFAFFKNVNRQVASRKNLVDTLVDTTEKLTGHYMKTLPT